MTPENYMVVGAFPLAAGIFLWHSAARKAHKMGLPDSWNPWWQLRRAKLNAPPIGRIFVIASAQQYTTINPDGSRVVTALPKKDEIRGAQATQQPPVASPSPLVQTVPPTITKHGDGVAAGGGRARQVSAPTSDDLRAAGELIASHGHNLDMTVKVAVLARIGGKRCVTAFYDPRGK